MIKVGKIFKSASATFGLIPGIAVIITSLGVPPDQSKILFGGLVEVFGVLSLLLLFQHKGTFRAQSSTLITKLVLIFIVISFMSLIGYLFLYSYCIVKHEDFDPVYFPLYASGELADQLKIFSRYELIGEYGRDGAIKLIKQSSYLNLIITSCIMLIIYIITFSSLTLAFGIPGIKQSSDE